MVAMGANQSGTDNVKQFNNRPSEELGRDAGVEKRENLVDQDKADKGEDAGEEQVSVAFKPKIIAVWHLLCSVQAGFAIFEAQVDKAFK